MVDYYVQLREVREAIRAADRALYCLENAERALSGARGWGMWDLLGGGAFSGMLKHGKIDDARRQIEEAKYQMSILRRELADVNLPMDLQIDIGGFMTFADFFLDGFVADFLVQSKIKKAQRQVQEARQQVSAVLNDLRDWENQLLSGA